MEISVHFVENIFRRISFFIFHFPAPGRAPAPPPPRRPRSSLPPAARRLPSRRTCAVSSAAWARAVSLHPAERSSSRRQPAQGPRSPPPAQPFGCDELDLFGGCHTGFAPHGRRGGGFVRPMSKASATNECFHLIFSADLHAILSVHISISPRFFFSPAPARFTIFRFVFLFNSAKR